MTIKKFLYNFEEYFVVWTMAIMTILVFIQVVMRYVFSNSLSWSEELARFIFLWVSWIGASYAVKEGDIIEVMFGQKPVRVKVTSVEAPLGKDVAREMYVVLDGETE